MLTIFFCFLNNFPLHDSFRSILLPFDHVKVESSRTGPKEKRKKETTCDMTAGSTDTNPKTWIAIYQKNFLIFFEGTFELKSGQTANLPTVNLLFFFLMLYRVIDDLNKMINVI